jgi:exodeoxyribonuclease V beta subunit
MWISAVRDWLEKSMEQPLSSGASGCRLSLHDLFQQGQFMPELTFDFSIGSNEDASDVPEINDALALEETAGIALAGNRIHGLMTGAIDLTFIHDDKVYLLDYKSNTLGRNPAHYDHAGMTDCMKSSRYDLQYLIYSTAVHRYFSTRFAQAYAFDPAPGRELSFGGVFYLFLRGMGIIEEAYARHGVWFRRPGFETVHALDRALRPSPERTDHDG